MHTDDKPCSILCLGQFQMYALDKHSNLLITIRVCAHFDWSRIIFCACAQVISLFCSRTCHAAVVGTSRSESDRGKKLVLCAAD